MVHMIIPTQRHPGVSAALVIPPFASLKFMKSSDISLDIEPLMVLTLDPYS